MAEDESGGLLNQQDINAALAAAGLETEAVAAEPADAPAPDEGAGAPAAPGADGADAPTSAAQSNARAESAGRPFDEVAAAMAAAIESEAAAQPESAAAAPPSPPPPDAKPFEVPELDACADAAGPQIQGIDLLRDVELDVKIELGRSRMLVDDVLRLHEGSVVELDKLAGDPVDVLVNKRLVARGEVLVLNDSFCVRINEIVSTELEDQ